ncbi:MAG TPA: endo-1,4-beta-xylanase, partial [Pilimelia sp.]|nr:endo-1,4-beta-xylanase [Pilimelia sp.]
GDHAAASGPLRTHAADRGKVIGTALATGPLASDATYRSLAATEFNQVTPENALKWDATEPNRGQFSFAGADAILASAAQNNQVVRGHTLVWHNQTPGWVQNLAAADLRTATQNHISTVVGRYRGRIAYWDVVNEAFADNGTLRNSFWLQKLGAGYIADAFRWARAADPSAKLYYNDYNIEGVGAKSDATYNLVRDLRAQGVPIDGVGLQAHLILGQVPASLQQNIARFAALGVDVAITELDIRMPTPATPERLAQQATDYRRVLDACLAVARCVGVTVWGFSDRHSWIPSVFPGQGAALPYDENYRPKPAYDAIHAAFGGGAPGPTTPGPTTAAPDRQPPTAPGQPTASALTAGGVQLSWPAATDNVRVAGYTVFRENGASDVQVATATGTTAAVAGLSPQTRYQFYVRARDAAGNSSADSPLVTVTTPAGAAAAACRVAYAVPSQWAGGFNGSVTISNPGATAIAGWTLRWAFTGGQTVQSAWGGTATQSGSQVSVTNADWTRVIAPGGAVTFGFSGTFAGSNPAPTAFTLNGAACQ